jgi:predicted transcriptional regulator
MTRPDFTIRGFRPPREAAMSSLGSLEQKVLDAAWRQGRVNVRQVVESLGGTVAYTTVMTTLDRLFKKGLLAREKEGRAFIYSPRMSSDEIQAGIAGDVIYGLIDGATKRVSPVLASIVDAVSERDRSLLDDLERHVKEKKAELARK